MPFVLIRKGRNVTLVGFLLLAELGIVMFVARRTATNEFKDFTAGIGYVMFSTGWNRDCIAWTYGTRFVSNAHLALSGENVIDLLGKGMIMPGRLPADRHSSFGQTLIADRGISMGKQFPKFRFIFGGKRLRLFDVLNVHFVPNSRPVAVQLAHDRRWPESVLN